MTGDQCCQRATLDILEGEIRQTVYLTDFVNLNDVGMLKPGDCLRFDPEACEAFRLGVCSCQDHFERDNAIEPELAGTVNNPHTAAAENFQDLVAGYARQ